MFDSNWDADQAVYVAIVLSAIAVIAFFLIRAFRNKTRKPWRALFVGLYNIVLLLLFLIGMLTQVGWEGFGFFPLLVLTTPWSWLQLWLLSSYPVFEGSLNHLSGAGLDGTFFVSFILFNVVAGQINSGILYFMLRRHEKKAAEDEAWEQARRNR